MNCNNQFTGEISGRPTYFTVVKNWDPIYYDIVLILFRHIVVIVTQLFFVLFFTFDNILLSCHGVDLLTAQIKWKNAVHEWVVKCNVGGSKKRKRKIKKKKTVDKVNSQKENREMATKCYRQVVSGDERQSMWRAFLYLFPSVGLCVAKKKKEKLLKRVGAA